MKRTRVTNGGTPVTSYYIFEGEHWIMEYDANGANTSNALYGIGMDEVIARGVGTQGCGISRSQRQHECGDRWANLVRESYRYDAFGAPTVRWARQQ